MIDTDILHPRVLRVHAATDCPKSRSSSATIRLYDRLFLALIGIGGGCFLLSSFAVAPALVEPEQIFDAIGMISIGQGMGLVFFVATAGVIFQNPAVEYVSPLVPAAQTADIRPLIAGTSSAIYGELSAATRAEVVAAVVRAMDRVYPLAIAASALSLIFSPFLGVSFRQSL